MSALRRKGYRRLLLPLTILVAAAAASATAVAFGGAAPGKPVPPVTGTVTTGGAPDGIAAAAHRALEALVAQQTIDQSQADAIQRQVDAGSVDPRTLVDGGVVTDAQMHAVATSLDAVKRAAGG